MLFTFGSFAASAPLRPLCQQRLLFFLSGRPRNSSFGGRRITPRRFIDDPFMAANRRGDGGRRTEGEDVAGGEPPRRRWVVNLNYSENVQTQRGTLERQSLPLKKEFGKHRNSIINRGIRQPTIHPSSATICVPRGEEIL